MNDSEFDIGMGLLTSAFPNAAPSVATLKVYHMMLSDLDGKTFALTIKRLLTTAKYLPTIAEIRSIADEISRPQLDSGAAWLAVKQAMRSDDRPTFDDPATEQAVKTIGWQRLCYSENPDEVRRQFFKVYAEYAKRQKENAVLPDSVRQLTAQVVKALPGGRT